MTDHGLPEPPLPAPARTPSRRWIIVAILFLGVLGASAIAWRWLQPSAPLSTQSPQDDDEADEPLVVVNPGYVGPEACGECHSPRLEECRKTRHFAACRIAEANLMPPGFTAETGTFKSIVSGIRFLLHRSGDDFLYTVMRETPEGEQRFSTRIDLIYGSGGKADEVFFTWQKDRLFELPMVWLHPWNQWGEEPYNPHSSGDFRRPTTTRCLECHNTWIEHVPGTENEYHPATLIPSVTCENCHGPGRDHVAYHRQHPNSHPGKAIVRPRGLSRDRQMDLCGQCHSNAMRPRGPMFSYRPGEPLEKHFRPSKLEGLENDHVADQVKYLRRGKCYQQSETLTCTTCHNPHRQTDPGAVNRSCNKCHKPTECREQQRVPAGVRTDCVGCHMPRYNRVAVSPNTQTAQYVFPVRPHNHQIAIYPAAEQEVLLKWYSTQPDAASKKKAAHLRESLGKHWLGEGEKLLRANRCLAAIGALREAVRLDPCPATRTKLKEVVALQAKIDSTLYAALTAFDQRHDTDAIDLFEAVLKLNPTVARAHGKLGTLYQVIGKPELARQHLKAVTTYDPDDPYGYNMLGWLAYLDNKAEVAVGYFRQANELQPFTVELTFRWGLALVKLKRWADAEQQFRTALLVDPRFASACQGLGFVLGQEGKPKEALIYAKRAARLTRFQNADVLLTLAEVYANNKLWTDALKTAERALTIAKVNSPHQVEQIRSRLEELRTEAARR